MKMMKTLACGYRPGANYEFRCVKSFNKELAFEHLTGDTLSYPEDCDDVIPVMSQISIITRHPYIIEIIKYEIIFVTRMSRMYTVGRGAFEILTAKIKYHARCTYIFNYYRN